MSQSPEELHNGMRRVVFKTTNAVSIVFTYFDTRTQEELRMN